MNNENERDFFLCKDSLDTINSVAWFMMDALWMLGLTVAGLFFIFPTVLSGLFLLYVEKRPAVLKINAAINCWIWMNSMWMISESFGVTELMPYARAMFAAGAAFIIAAAMQSGSVRETFSHFRRFRSMKLVSGR